ncbi:serine/threonine-protein kinase [Streptomyces violaceoruber]
MQGRLVAGRYRLGEAIGSGGMGRVWRAHDEVLHRTVAIKEMTAALYVSESDQAILLARTRGEARAAARINHSAVVTVHDVLEHDGRPWIVMELVEGRSLADAVKEEERVDPREAARVGLWVLRALRAAHTAGVLHRDVKPGNVLLADDGRVLLTDFGIAQIEGDSTITRTGEVVGSVDYLAPERVRGHDPGPSSDLWALGATLYTAVEGRSPFRRTSPLTTMQAVVEEEATEPRYAGALAPVISALLRKDPAERLPAEEAERALRLVGAGGAPPGRGPRTGAPPSGAFAPTVVAAHPGLPTAPTPPMPVAAAGDTSAAGAPGAPGGRDRRARAVLLVGLAVLVLTLAGLTYSLLDRSDGGGGTEGSGGSPGPGATSAATSGGAGEPSPPASSGTDGGQSGPAAQSVEVTVVGSRTHYSGACPPPHDRAPAFTATFTVGRLPAEVGYRWVTADGSVSDPGWRTLSFPSGGERSRQDGVVVTTHDDTGAFESAVRVEVRSPVRATSDAVAFSVTCGTGTETETGTGTPSGGASHSSSPSAPSSSPSA